MADGAFVILKSVLHENYPELEIHRYLMTEPLASDPRNPCVPLLDVLQLPESDVEEGVLLVTPLLRKFDNPRFETFGEAVAFFTQIFSVRRSSSNIISLTIDGTLGLAIFTRT